MKVVLQRVKECKVEIDNLIYSEIEEGLLVLLGISVVDKEEDADYLVKKISALRIFSDEHGKMNNNVMDIGGAIMVVSQFTLFANTKKGNRPSFIKAAKHELAIPLYEYFINQLIMTTKWNIASGKFGALMNIHLINDGPVTIIINSKKEKS